MIAAPALRFEGHEAPAPLWSLDEIARLFREAAGASSAQNFEPYQFAGCLQRSRR